MSALTPWFSGDVTPVREGLYQRGSDDSHFMWYWNSLYWEFGGWAREHCDASKVYRSQTLALCQSMPWRGLASDPAKAKKVSP